jgi:hypothetical protein
MSLSPDTGNDDELHFVRRLVSWPRYRKGDDGMTAGGIAREIINYLRLANWRFHRGPPAAGHSTPGPRRGP